jgi:hypothetical protein
LLIILCKSLINNGSIVADGTDTICDGFQAWSSGFGCGGGSGGGSIQIFYKDDTIKQGTITVTPGRRAGIGSIRAQKIDKQSFLFENIL